MRKLILLIIKLSITNEILTKTEKKAPVINNFFFMVADKTYPIMRS